MERNIFLLFILFVPIVEWEKYFINFIFRKISFEVKTFIFSYVSSETHLFQFTIFAHFPSIYMGEFLFNFQFLHIFISFQISKRLLCSEFAFPNKVFLHRVTSVPNIASLHVRRDYQPSTLYKYRRDWDSVRKSPFRRQTFSKILKRCKAKNC